MFESVAAAASGDSEKEPMPTMGFLDHLEELRKRIVYSIIAVGVGTGLCWGYRVKIYAVMQKPIMDALRSHGLAEKLVYLNPTDPFNMYLKIAMLAGLFLTSPFVLYQVWMFISPGLYRNEKRYVMPFMFSTITLFTLGGYFGYRIAYPRALDFFIGFSGQFQPMITVGEYTQLFMIKNFRYAILVIFVLAAIVTPTPDIVNMCVFAAPMLALYALSIGVAWMVHPKQRQARKEKQSKA